MPKNINLIDLDVDKIFQERSIDEIVAIEKILNAEIEKKRNELRSMVGDRYKDVLAASDAIKSMKTISEDIVNDIETITTTCEKLICSPVCDMNSVDLEIDNKKVEERILIIQVRLAIFVNEQIWIALDDQNNLEAAQFYLLAQHIHTGLSLSKKEYLDKLPILKHLKLNLVVLRSKIFQRITENLECVEITAKETSCNLNALMLLENQSSNQLLSIFIEHRKTALNTVMNTQYASVRLQVGAMVRCLVTTILLLHDCFIYTEDKNGLIWQQLYDILGEKAPPTMSKLHLPATPLVTYIPEIIKQFRPKCKVANNQITAEDTKNVLQNWLHSTQQNVKVGLLKSLQSVTNVKGLHLTREEALKIGFLVRLQKKVEGGYCTRSTRTCVEEFVSIFYHLNKETEDLPSNWGKICTDSHLPEDFDIWYFFFQDLLTARAETLITNIITKNLESIQKDISKTLSNAGKSHKSEADLRWYAWSEESSDVSRNKNNHMGLSMKTKGYSQNIVELCRKIDNKYLELLEDVSLYLYGKEYSTELSIPSVLKDFKFKRKFIDKEKLENHLRSECVNHSAQIARFVENLLNTEEDFERVKKSIVAARFLQAVCKLCPNFNKCCELNKYSEDWQKICDHFLKTSYALWTNWVDNCALQTEKEMEKLNDISPSGLIKNLTRWDEIEIQEQTEDKVFKSQIKVPLKPSVPLTNLLVKLNDDLSRVLPFTLPNAIHHRFIEKNVDIILNQYKTNSEKELNQVQALQFLFDVRFLTVFCVSRENGQLVTKSQDICDKLRSKIDPFDLDVFYSYLQSNVRRAVVQSQMIFGCLLPSTSQLTNVGAIAKTKEQEKVPSLLGLSSPSNNYWFPLLPVTIPSQKPPGGSAVLKVAKEPVTKTTAKPSPKKAQDAGMAMRAGAATLFGGLTTDWFS